MHFQRFLVFFVSRTLCILSCMFSYFNLATAATSTNDLTDLRVSAQARIESHYSADWVAHQSSALSRWLIGPPTLEMSALRSNSAVGTDEFEIRLGVQVQRPDNVDLFDEMAQVNDAILVAQQRQQQLLVSGMVRQRLWDAALARQQVVALRDKQVWLEQLGKQLTERFEAGELSRLAYLQWQQQRLDVQQDLIAAEASLTATMEAYTDLTGADILPADMAESLPQNMDASLNAHPEFRLLSLQKQYASTAYQYARQSQANWELAVVAKRLQSVLGDENQIGLTVGIPLTINAPANPQDLQAWQQTDVAMTQSMNNLRIGLLQQLAKLRTSLTSSSAQIAVAEQQVALGQQIVEQLQALKQNSELEQSNWLTSLLDQRDRTYQLEFMKLSQQQLVAQINQLAGQAL